MKNSALAHRLVLLLVTVVAPAGLVLVSFHLGRRSAANAATDHPSPAGEDRSALVAELAKRSPGIYDSHNDPAVGHVNLPNLRQRKTGGVPVTTNRYGFREREWLVPKPPDRVRIVLLGDSFVFGSGAAAEARLGAVLEQQLASALKARGDLEVLHIGVPSWNIESATTFLRRSLGNLDPDLVLFLSLPNDIEDTAGVRGFGHLASFSPQNRWAADSLLEAGFAMREYGVRRVGYLRHGFDHASRTRYARSARALEELASALEERRIPLRVLFHYRHLLPVVRRELGNRLAPEQGYYLAESFGGDRTTWVSTSDHHWNAKGHQIVALALYELIRRDRLLDDRLTTLGHSAELPQVAEAREAFESVLERGAKEAEESSDPDHLLRVFGNAKIRESVDFNELDATGAAQVHGGIDRNRRLSPRAQVVLRNSAATKLRIRGSVPSHLALLPDSSLAVLVNDTEVGAVVLRPGKSFVTEMELPRQVRHEEFLTVELRSSDFGYAGPSLQHCVSATLDWIGLQ